ncbi:HAD family hydrolase (plasmid) [Streptosporangium sp. NBC_01495]|uniref:HAD family hydrolase n=1 Tax=Streptosporangium sp. NBC_01495 TaxID=2903899 RepID=UPI002E2EBB5B|nr:HAD family hydrolase [Streptosporangium sp. NBC_01495]
MALDYGGTLTDPDAPIDLNLGMRPVCPLVAETLHELHESGYGLILASNTAADLRQDRQAALRAAGVLDLFTATLTSADLLIAKPSAAFYRLVLAAAGCPPDQVTFVGNNLLKDVVQPMAHGMRAVFLTRSPRMAEELPKGVSVISHLKELPPLLMAGAT